MGLTGFNRARREAAARASAETDTTETMDGLAKAGSETKDTGEADTESELGTASPTAKSPAGSKTTDTGKADTDVKVGTGSPTAKQPVNRKRKADPK